MIAMDSISLSIENSNVNMSMHLPGTYGTGADALVYIICAEGSLITFVLRKHEVAAMADAIS